MITDKYVCTSDPFDSARQSEVTGQSIIYFRIVSSGYELVDPDNHPRKWSLYQTQTGSKMYYQGSLYEAQEYCAKFGDPIHVDKQNACIFYRGKNNG